MKEKLWERCANNVIMTCNVIETVLGVLTTYEKISGGLCIKGITTLLL